MTRVSTRISVTGFNVDEVREGLPALIDELCERRDWLLKSDAFWDEARSRLVVTVEREGDDPLIEGGDGGANFDDVWDCVIACVNFSSKGIHFDIEESRVIESES